jgi:L-lactate dehydrogenase complex protein LldG
MQGDTPWEVFRANLEAVHGRMFRDADGLAGFLAANGHRRGYCDPALAGLLAGPMRAAGLEVVTTFDRADYDNLAFGITRGTAAIAESGSIVLDDTLTSDRLAALAPWVHVAVLPDSALIQTIAEAVTLLGSCPNVIWCTGPSKTADVEGILIEGVHGPGEQIALVLPAAIMPAPIAR